MIAIVFVALLVVYGAYLAFAVRNVVIPQANDSKQIVIAIYNILVFGAICLSLVEVVQNNPTALYLMIASLIFLCATVIQMVLFVPRMLDVSKGNTEVNLTMSTVTNTGVGGTTRSGTSHTSEDNAVDSPEKVSSDV